MTYDPTDDPMLTAYALGELADDDAQRIEAQLESDPVSRAHVETLRAEFESLRHEFRNEAAPEGLGALRHARIEQAIQKRKTPPRRLGMIWRIAAIVVILVGATAMILPMFTKVRFEARKSASFAQLEPQTDSIDKRIDRSDRAREPKLALVPNPADAPMPVAEAPPVVATVPAPTSAPVQTPAAAAPAARAAPSAPASSVERRNVRTFIDQQREITRNATKDLGVSPQPLSPAAKSIRPQPDGSPFLEEAIRSPKGVENRFVDTEENPFTDPSTTPLSTFGLEVDTASYAIVRRFLMQDGQLPPKGAVRIEEMVNAFDYDTPEPEDGETFAIHTEVASAPWAPKHRLLRIALRAKSVPEHLRPQANIVFLIDVSGSMRGDDKIELLKSSLRELVMKLDGDDRVAIVTYAGDSRVALPSTPAAQRDRMLEVIQGLQAGGSTNGAGGIHAAYAIAQENFLKGGINRVFLATDGDFNVGVSSTEGLEELITQKRATGVYLSVLGFGRGNLQDAKMERLSNKGNGVYAYIDTPAEGRRVLVHQISGSLMTLARNAKIQVEFNPARVGSYRLIGYANRRMAAEDFRDDMKDAGEIGAGHTVTALYEIVPAGLAPRAAEALRYQKPAAAPVQVPVADAAPHARELCFVKLRWQAPDTPEGAPATEKRVPVSDSNESYLDSSNDFRVSSALAGFGMLLRDSPSRGIATYDLISDLAAGALGEDSEGRRKELVQLIRTAGRLERQ